MVDDKGYPDSKMLNTELLSSDKQKILGQLRARHECINGRFKMFGVLKNVFRHGLESHGVMFRAVVNIVQATFIHGNPPFMVEY